MPSANARETPSRTLRGTGLRHSDDRQPGISRQRAGRGFRYVDSAGAPVRDGAVLERIRRLAIPPAYTEVWICARADGHLQATGRDARGRKQYRYHPDWVRQRGADKFARILAFGRALPALRGKLRRHLALPGLPRDKVLALVVTVMGRTYARIGNDAYARSNHSYGLTTLCNRHLHLCAGARAEMRFAGKSGRSQHLRIDDRRLVALIRRCHDLPGKPLFQYRDDAGRVRPVDSGDVNAYLKRLTGSDFTAKDFRTWGATLTAMIELARLPVPADADERTLAPLRNRVVAAVAATLGNTPAVCRKSYIDPRVFRAWQDGALRPLRALRGIRQCERAALKVLKACPAPR
ncbi:DNA topoisomerase [Stenotrophomonas daejeonensis]|uniref:DNA topoisomerase n=1 Tax=Stenotrophomonas daejeonensis TaxID=659018 RepID=A0A0R0E2G9_9GAMM|nr:DNA topoisomerase IB [Stenotrophomonas daejeonensis]KRG88037.1 DNA topoisomerase [Stenotrophomonas daejeonensis]